MNEQLDSLENDIHNFLDIEIYSAEEILKAEGVKEPDKNMSTAYLMAINRAKRIVSACIRSKKYG